MSGRAIAYVSSTDVPICRHPTRLWAWSSSSPLIFLANTRCSTHAYHSRRHKFCCRRTAYVEQFTGYYRPKTDHQLRTVQATSENAFIQGLDIAVHWDSWLLCAIQMLLLTYLLTAKPIEVKWVQGTTHLVRPGTSPKEGAISQSIVSVGIIRRAVDILNDFQ